MKSSNDFFPFGYGATTPYMLLNLRNNAHLHFLSKLKKTVTLALKYQVDIYDFF